MPQKNLQIRHCSTEDIVQVIDINVQWQKTNLGDNLSEGFVTGNLDINYLLKVMERREVIVALLGSTVVGYAMINDKEHSPLSMAKVNEFLHKGYLSKDTKIAVGTQAAVILEYRGRGIAKTMIRELAHTIKWKYDIMISMINKLNYRSIQAHMNKNGWKVFDENEENLYVFYDLHLTKANQKYFPVVPESSF